MEPVAFAVLSLGLLVACDQSGEIMQGPVVWMEWPAEVQAGESFSVRSIVIPPSCVWEDLVPRSRADQSAVTIAPYFVGVQMDVNCITTPPQDTLVNAPGLAADLPRTYEIRATTNASGSDWRVENQRVRTFGEVTVRPTCPGPSVRNAAGYVLALTVDTLNCLRLIPPQAHSASEGLVLENPIDTADISGAFVRGYIHEVATPGCGETRVFHLVSRN